MISSLAKALGAAALAAAAVILGTAWHRAAVQVGQARAPLGLVLAIVMILAVFVAVRAWAGWAGIVGSALVAIVMPQLLALMGPGGDLLIQGDKLGYVWLFSPILAVLLTSVAPRSWFGRNVQ